MATEMKRIMVMTKYTVWQFGWQFDASSRQVEGVVANSRFPEGAGMTKYTVCQVGWQFDAKSRQFEGVVASSRLPEGAGMRERWQFATLIVPFINLIIPAKKP